MWLNNLKFCERIYVQVKQCSPYQTTVCSHNVKTCTKLFQQMLNRQNNNLRTLLLGTIKTYRECMRQSGKYWLAVMMSWCHDAVMYFWANENYNFFQFTNCGFLALRIFSFWWVIERGLWWKLDLTWNGSNISGNFVTIVRRNNVYFADLVIN